MKKIVNVVGSRTTYKGGGGQKYSRILYSNLAKEFNIEEIWLRDYVKESFFEIKNKKMRAPIFKTIKGGTYVWNIDPLTLIFTSLKNDRNILVDHGQNVIKKQISKNSNLLFFNKFLIKRKLKKMELVTYTQFDKRLWEKHFSFKKIHVIPLSTKECTFVDSSLKDDLLFVGRDSKEKRVDLNIKFSENIGKKITLVGPKTPNDMAVGYKTQQWIDEFYKNTPPSFITMFSDSEGFSYSLVEAISHSIPILALDNYPAIKYIVGPQDQRGIIGNSIKELETKYIHLTEEDYKKMKLNSYEFCKQELKEEKFIDRWRRVLLEY